MTGIGIVEPPHPILYTYIRGLVCRGKRSWNNQLFRCPTRNVIWRRTVEKWKKSGQNTDDKNTTHLNADDGSWVYNRVRCFSRAVLTTGGPECSNIKPASTWCREGSRDRRAAARTLRSEVTAENRANALRDGHIIICHFRFYIISIFSFSVSFSRIDANVCRRPPSQGQKMTAAWVQRSAGWMAAYELRSECQ